jgi:Cof subfamily protein (haloacid dehalogenase superfamily)
MKQFRLFVADIDNTLRSRNMPVPGPLTRKAFEDMHERGIILGIASGRPLWQNVKDHYKEWKLHQQFDFLIGLNGGELLDSSTGKTSIYNQLSVEELKEIVEAFKDLPNTNPFVYRPGIELCRYVDDEMEASGVRHGTKVVACSSDADLYSEPTGKILYRCGTAENGEKVEKLGQKLFGNRISCFRTAPCLVELQSPKNNKGTALIEYCKRHDIPLENVYAFGDAENDIELLQAAGTSVCLKNGMDNVKAVSDYVTEYSVEEDGVGRWLYDHKLL